MRTLPMPTRSEPFASVAEFTAEKLTASRPAISSVPVAVVAAVAAFVGVAASRLLARASAREPREPLAASDSAAEKL